MKTVRIPTIGSDPMVVEINNKRYVYNAGEEYSVPDDVAELILQRANIDPAEFYKPDPLDAARATIGGVKEAIADSSGYNQLAEAINEILDVLIEADVIPEPLLS